MKLHNPVGVRVSHDEPLFPEEGRVGSFDHPDFA